MMRRPAGAATSYATPVLVALVIGLGGAPAAACEVKTLMELPVTITGGKPLVPVKINGADATMIVDTGAFFSGMTAELATQLSLPRHPLPASLHIGAGNWEVATVQALTLGNATFHNVDFIVGGRIANVGASGRLGQNMFATPAIEYDLGHRKIRLLQAEGCHGTELAYWRDGGSVSALPLDRLTPTQPQPRGIVKINGAPVHVMFDTGAPNSHVDRAAAVRAGIDLAAASVRSAPAIRRAVGGDSISVVEAIARSITIGVEQAKDTPIRVADGTAPSGEGLIGMDFFLAHRIILDQKNGHLYFTSNSGQLFESSEIIGPGGASTSAGRSNSGDLEKER